MKALTLWQPWASLIGRGFKRYETRSWGTNYRGPLAIHAGAHGTRTSINETMFDIEFEVTHGERILFCNVPQPKSAVVAICHLADCIEMTPEFIDQQTLLERSCGDWQPGRFAWKLTAVNPLISPVPARGAQGLWNWIEAEVPLPTETTVKGEVVK